MRLLQGPWQRLLAFLSRSARQPVRNLYWNLRAKEIDARYGQGTADYDVVREVLREVRPRRLLDIGCGSGRLFPLYREMRIEEIVAQEVAAAAIRMCRKRYPDMPVSYTSREILELPYPADHFDLIISNRVLSAILPEHIAPVLERLARIGRALYINEMSESDGPMVDSSYWFCHDYGALVSRWGFIVARSGMMGRQTWRLYRKGAEHTRIETRA